MRKNACVRGARIRQLNTMSNTQIVEYTAIRCILTQCCICIHKYCTRVCVLRATCTRKPHGEWKIHALIAYQEKNPPLESGHKSRFGVPSAEHFQPRGILDQRGRNFVPKKTHLRRGSDDFPKVSHCTSMKTVFTPFHWT